MADFYILDSHRRAVPIADVLTWAKLFNEKNRVVAKTTVGEAHVSTVFLGINQSHFDGPPLLFETMIFGGPDDLEQHRYSTWNDAVAGHAAVVARLTHAR